MSRAPLFDTMDTLHRKQQAEHDRRYAPHEDLPACVGCGDPARWGTNEGHFCTLCRPDDFLDFAKAHSAQMRASTSTGPRQRTSEATRERHDERDYARKP